MSGATRCSPGDLAIVRFDEPGCEDNIGRIVEVRGPLKINRDLGLACWLIRPVHRGRWAVMEGGLLRLEIVEWRSLIEHPDAWLAPIGPGEPLDLEALPVTAPVHG